MADHVREIERKYEATGDDLPDLTVVAGVATVAADGVTDLDATYYDTPDQRLAADRITLRRRTGGSDAGWHLKLPEGLGAAPGAAGAEAGPGDVREEIRAPLSEALPAELAQLVRSRVRRTPVVPVVRLRSRRDVRHLLAADGARLAEISVDEVTAERLSGGAGIARWTEIEAELAADTAPGFLDAIERVLTDAGIRRSAAPSKLARALAETAPGVAEGEAPRKSAGEAAPGPTDVPTGGPATKKPAAGKPASKKAAAKKSATSEKPAAEKPATTGELLLRHLRRQITAIVTLDPAVRRDVPDSVHRMRVATRRLRSAFASFRTVLDRRVTDPLAADLKWLAAELGVDRDREVLTARLDGLLGELPGPLVVGPVRDRLRSWSQERRSGSRHHVATVLDSARYLDLLDALDALLADPPLLPDAGRPPLDVLPRAVLRDVRRLGRRVETALAAPRGAERDIALHEARKAAKRTRYAAEAARPAVGKPAGRLVGHMRALQEALGDHQDSVVARAALQDLAEQAQAAGESAFTYGLLYGHEEARAAARERELPAAWREASRKKLLKALGA